MRVAGMAGSPEADLVRRVKTAAPGAKVAVTLDLHANLTTDLVAAADVVQSFRANPHWDLFPTGLRAGRTLIRLLRDEVRPVAAWRKLPVVLGGGTGISSFTPTKGIFTEMKRLHRAHPALLHTSFNMVHPFSDAPDIGWTVHVMTDGDTVWLDLGEVQLVASTQPPLSAHPRFFRALGCDPRKADLILQKSFFQYRILYAGISHHHVPVASPGPTDLHAAARRSLPEPTFPAHEVADWRGFDAVMRGLSAERG
jgi:microcystin degradation protein MlrC